MNAPTDTLRPGALQIDIDEAEGIVSDLTTTIDGILDMMLVNESDRKEMTATLMAAVSARYLIRNQVEAALAAEKSEADNG